MSGLPNTRRIILSHDPKTGKPAVIDDKVPMQPQESGCSLGVAYTQTTFVGKPENALAGATATPDKMFMHSTGVTSAIIGTSSCPPFHRS